MNSHIASFRDPAGFVFSTDGIFYRQINNSYSNNYEFFMSSGLYKNLVNENLLLPHNEEKKLQNHQDSDLYKIIKPQQLHTISYPYEWSFGMLKDSALLTLKICQIALNHGMILKDANAFNVQFLNGKPIFIDTLSFEIYQPNSTWQAYKQFCEQFLAPLSLMSRTDISLNKMLILQPKGIPLGLATKLLPFKSRFSFGLYLHLFLHSKLDKKNKEPDQYQKPNQRVNLNQILESLKSTIENLLLKPAKTNWNNYYSENVTSEYLEIKKKVFERFVSKTNSEVIVDLGANDGEFSLIASKYASEVISTDSDAFCIENNFQILKKQENSRILPLVLDITNPTSGIGWENLERNSFWERAKPNTIVALALIHHLSITHYLPFEYIASFFSKKAKFLIIEFVPPEDVKVQFLLKNVQRKFDNYTYNHFVKTFNQYFSIAEQSSLNPTNRILFLMQRHDF